MTQTAALYRLQQLDSELATTRGRLAEIADLLNRNEAVRAAQLNLEQAEGAYRTWRIRQNDLELERSQLETEADEDEKYLYSGKVTNPRLLIELQNKIASLRRRYAELEEPLLEAMLGVEESSQALHEAKQNLDRVLAEQAHNLGALSAEQAACTARCQELEVVIQRVRAEIEASHLTLYDGLRRTLGGVAVSLVNGDECGVCGVQLTSHQVQQVRHGQVMTCPTCNRILYIP